MEGADTGRAAECDFHGCEAAVVRSSDYAFEPLNPEL
jgi:hypothetical protein